ncbi:MAG: ribonuclease HII [Hydrogenothermaceae bacterium]|nr:ribonuclease HII [Hydrogenothermaceae bacterium]
MDSLERELYGKGYERIVGIDEAGRGPLAGPVVAAAVILPKNQKPFLTKDSKKTSEKDREKLFEIIVENGYVGIGIASAQEIDQLNILNATKLASKRALENLKLTFDVVITDYLDLGIENQISLKKADETVHCVAAASIVAKVTRDKIMRDYKQLYPEFSFDKHKGYPTELHYREIEKYGITPIHRKSFKLYRGEK